MEINSWPGLIAVILAIISFYGMTYVVVALNTGWRFGYWICGAVFGALMVLMSIFWIVTGLGPQGKTAVWEPVAADADRISQAQIDGEPVTSAGRYPTGWRAATKEDDAQTEAFESGMTNCLTTDPKSLEEEFKQQCTAAQGLLPDDKEIPVLEGAAVAVLPEFSDVRFIEEEGALLAQALVVPMTHDPRIADDAIKGEQMGDEFRILAVYDEGSLRVPSFASLAIFIVFAAFHLWGLHRAEQRKLSPVA